MRNTYLMIDQNCYVSRKFAQSLLLEANSVRILYVLTNLPAVRDNLFLV